MAGAPTNTATWPSTPITIGCREPNGEDVKVLEYDERLKIYQARAMPGRVSTARPMASKTRRFSPPRTAAAAPPAPQSQALQPGRGKAPARPRSRPSALIWILPCRPPACSAIDFVRRLLLWSRRMSADACSAKAWSAPPNTTSPIWRPSNASPLYLQPGDRITAPGAGR